MVGHASSHLLANLMDSPRAEDAGLAKLVIADCEQTLTTVKPKMDALQKEIDALAGPAAEARKAVQKLEKDDQSPEAQARRKAHEEVKAKIDALAKEKGELLRSVRYNEGKKVRIAAFGEVDRGKRATGIAGPVAPGCGSNATNIGPEYGFGMALESKLDSPVLLIKVSWGGIDLDGGFRPPSSKKVGHEAEPPPSPGPKYQELVKQVHAVLADLKTYHPAYDPAAGYELAGFYWFQGFNDQFGDKPTRYREHMANFIRDIRAEFKAPAMPFVIGVIGTGAAAKKTDYSTLSHAAAVELGKQETADQPVAVAQREAAALPEFAGTVVAVESYPYYDYAILPLYEVWKDRFSEWKNAGSDRPYHYLGSARFFARFGHACGEAMVELGKKP
jgi:alpha-galactosidase